MVQISSNAWAHPLLVIAVTALGCRRSDQGPLPAGGREISFWIADLRDPKPQVRRQAVLKLGNVGDDDPAVAEGLALASTIPMYWCAAMPYTRW